MTETTVHIQANAKVNWSLSVGEPLESGLHTIESKMARIAFCDELEVTRLEQHALSRYAIFWNENAPKQSEIDWPVTSDLAVKAHRLLESRVGHPLPVQMKLEKRIPVGGGLGGGSADGAAMFQATVALFNLDIDLVELAAELGSDVPFLLHGGSANVSGVGTVIEPIDQELQHLVLAFPEYSCSTADVYNAFDAIETVEPNDQLNDLLYAACTVEPKLEMDMTTLASLLELEIHLSGSGSTMFAICDNAEHATAVAKQIEEHTNLVAVATQTC